MFPDHVGCRVQRERHHLAGEHLHEHALPSILAHSRVLEIALGLAESVGCENRVHVSDCACSALREHLEYGRVVVDWSNLSAQTLERVSSLDGQLRLANSVKTVWHNEPCHCAYLGVVSLAQELLEALGDLDLAFQNELQAHILQLRFAPLA